MRHIKSNSNSADRTVQCIVTRRSHVEGSGPGSTIWLTPEKAKFLEEHGAVEIVGKVEPAVPAPVAPAPEESKPAGPEEAKPAGPSETKVDAFLANVDEIDGVVKERIKEHQAAAESEAADPNPSDAPAAGQPAADSASSSPSGEGSPSAVSEAAPASTETKPSASGGRGKRGGAGS